LRLDLARALALADPIEWVEQEEDGPHGKLADPAPLGDVVVARKHVPTSNHLAFTGDDAIQGVTLVTRGEALATATHVHRVLQALSLPTPRYRRHELMTDAAGRRRFQTRPRADHSFDAAERHQPGGNNPSIRGYGERGGRLGAENSR
jgi:glutamyl-Q tRNA(Asp) synthetase